MIFFLSVSLNPVSLTRQFHLSYLQQFTAQFISQNYLAIIKPNFDGSKVRKNRGSNVMDGEPYSVDTLLNMLG